MHGQPPDRKLPAVRTPPGLDRFLTFVDAIVAIAVTLLILPLVEITLLVSSALLTVLAVHLARKPELHENDVESSRRMAVPSVITTALLTVATVIGILVPQVNYGTLLLLLLTGAISTLLDRRLRRS